jgi:hypothetical protein
MRDVLLAAFCGAAAVPAYARPFRIEDVVAFPTVREVAVSPDHTHVALLVREADLARGRFGNGVWLVTTDGSAPARRLFSWQPVRGPRGAVRAAITPQLRAAGPARRVVDWFHAHDRR